MQFLTYAASFPDKVLKHFLDEMSLSSPLGGKHNLHSGTVPFEGCRIYIEKKLNKVPK